MPLAAAGLHCPSEVRQRMPKAKKPKAKNKTSSDNIFAPVADEQIVASNLTLHELFQRHAAAMVERADLSDEQKQSILIAMSCPCCGAGAMSFTAKLKRTP